MLYEAAASAAICEQLSADQQTADLLTAYSLPIQISEISVTVLEYQPLTLRLIGKVAKGGEQRMTRTAAYALISGYIPIQKCFYDVRNYWIRSAWVKRC